MKYVYFFGAGKADGTGDMRDLLGGKGAGLAEMTRIGLPVPAGFTITTECCDYFLTHGRKYPRSFAGKWQEHRAAGKTHRQRNWVTPKTRCWSACGPVRRGPCRE